MKRLNWMRWRAEGDLEEEIDAHPDLETQSHVERGLTPEAARRAALRRFGNPAGVKEQARENDPFFTLVLAVTMFATLIPVGRASRVDPALSLRSE